MMFGLLQTLLSYVTSIWSLLGIIALIPVLLKVSRFHILMKNIEKLPEKKRLDAVKAELNQVPPPTMSAEQYINYRSQPHKIAFKYFVVVLIAGIIGIALLVGFGAYHLPPFINSYPSQLNPLSTPKPTYNPNSVVIPAVSPTVVATSAPVPVITTLQGTVSRYCTTLETKDIDTFNTLVPPSRRDIVPRPGGTYTTCTFLTNPPVICTSTKQIISVEYNHQYKRSLFVQLLNGTWHITYYQDHYSSDLSNCSDDGALPKV